MTSKSSQANSRRTDSSHADSKIEGSRKSSRVESNPLKKERRRSVESLEVDTRDPNIGGRNSSQQSLIPGNTVNSSLDTKLRDLQIQQAALESIRENDEGQDSDESGSEKEPRRRHRSSRHGHEKERRRSRSPPEKKIITTRITFDKLSIFNRNERVEITRHKKSRSDKHDNDKKSSRSDQRSTDLDRRAYPDREDKKTERETKKSTPAGSHISSKKTSVSSEPKPATSSRHSATTHGSARVGDNVEQVPRARSHRSSKSTGSQNTHDEVDNEPSPGDPEALSEGSASGSLNGRPPQSNTSASDHQSLKSNLNIYSPDRGGKGTSTTAPSDNGSAERAQTGYGRGDHSNPPYFYEDETKQSDISASTGRSIQSRRASTRNSIAANSKYTASERAPSGRGKAAADERCTFEDETKQSDISASTGCTPRGRRSHRS